MNQWGKPGNWGLWSMDWNPMIMIVRTLQLNWVRRWIVMNWHCRTWRNNIRRNRINIINYTQISLMLISNYQPLKYLNRTWRIRWSSWEHWVRDWRDQGRNYYNDYNRRIVVNSMMRDHYCNTRIRHNNWSSRINNWLNNYSRIGEH